MHQLHRHLLKIFLSVLMLSPFAALAQEAYPSKTVRIIVPWTAGGGTDALARLVAQALTDKWGKPVVVENRPGGEGVIGSQVVAQAPADGHTLLWAIHSHVITPSVRTSMPFDTLKAFSAITLVANTPYVVAVPPSLGVSNIAGLVALAKARPGKLSYGSSDSSARIMGEMIQSTAGIEIVNVPYKGSAQIMTDLIGGHIQIGFVSLPSAMQHHKAGTLKMLGVSTLARSPFETAIPTLSESGLKDFDFPIWYGLLAPAGTPPDIVAKIHADLLQASGQPEFRATLSKAGANLVLNTPQVFDAFLKIEAAKAEKTVRAAGMKPE